MTNKEKLFCEAYFTLHSEEEAAKRAGFSEKAQKKTGELLRKKKIREYLSKLDDETPPLSLTKSAVRGLERLAFSTDSNVLKLVSGEESDADLFCVSEIKKNEKGTVEIKFCDRIRALTTLYEIGRAQDESASVPFFEALKNAVPEADDGV